MIRTAKLVGSWLSLLAASAFFLYVVAYLVVVQRSVTITTLGEGAGGKTKTVDYAVGRSVALGLIDEKWFGPLIHLDNKYVRPHHWDSQRIEYVSDGMIVYHYSGKWVEGVIY